MTSSFHGPKRSAFALALTALVFAGLASSAVAQVGTGWTQRTYSRTIQLDKQTGSQSFPWATTTSATVDSPKSAEYRRSGDIETFWIYDNRSNRAEIRMHMEYSTGQRQFQGYVTFSAPLDDESLMQVFGSTSGATQLMIRGYSASGGSLRGGGATLATNIYGKETRVNTVHVQGQYIRVYINGSQKVQITDNEAVDNYMKYGCYGTLRTGSVRVQWRAVRFYSK